MNLEFKSHLQNLCLMTSQRQIHQMSVEKTDGNYPCGLHYVYVLLMVRDKSAWDNFYILIYTKLVKFYLDNSLGKLVHKLVSWNLTLSRRDQNCHKITHSRQPKTL